MSALRSFVKHGLILVGAYVTFCIALIAEMGALAVYWAVTGDTTLTYQLTSFTTDIIDIGAGVFLLPGSIVYFGAWNYAVFPAIVALSGLYIIYSGVSE